MITEKNGWRRGRILLLALPFMIVAGVTFLQWVFFNFNPHFLSIDKCLDLGGVWSEKNSLCLARRDVLQKDCAVMGGQWETYNDPYRQTCTGATGWDEYMKPINAAIEQERLSRD